MDQEQQQPSPINTTPPSQPPMDGPGFDKRGHEGTPTGPVIAIAIIVVVIVIGGFYVWSGSFSRVSGPSVEEIINTQDAETQALESQSTDDDVAAIEADLNASNFEDLDAEFNDIDAELQGL